MQAILITGKLHGHGLVDAADKIKHTKYILWAFSPADIQKVALIQLISFLLHVLVYHRREGYMQYISSKPEGASRPKAECNMSP